MRSTGMQFELRIDSDRLPHPTELPPIFPLALAPVYFIVAHSSYDYVFKERMSNPHTVILEETGPDLLTLPDDVIYVSTTPAGAIGLMYEECESERDDSIVNSTGSTVKEWLRQGDVEGSCVAPGGSAVDRRFDFNGETLSGGGMGIVKLEDGKSLGDLIKASGLEKNKMYKAMRSCGKIGNIVNEAVRRDGLVSLKDIVRTLGQGIYISMCCSNVEVYMQRAKSTRFAHMPYASGRGLARSLYDHAFNHLRLIDIDNNNRWRRWIEQGRPKRKSTVLPPTADFTFKRTAIGEFALQNARYGVLTRRAAKEVSYSYKQYPAIE